MVEIAAQDMGIFAKPGRSGLGPGIAASILLHLILLSAAFWLIAAPAHRGPPEESAVRVEILPPPRPKLVLPPPPVSSDTILSSPPEIEAPQRPPVQTPASTVPESAIVPPSSETRGASSGMIRATKLLAAAALADPRSAQAASAMKTLAPEEQVEQLCNLEAMEQIAAENQRLNPDYLVAYAMSNTRRRGGSFEANGAAFRSNGKWYSLRYACDVSENPLEVAGFSFEIGAEIPRAEWAEHFLTASAPADGQ